MTLLSFFGIVSGLLSALCYIPYIRDILADKTKPERASWFIWTCLGTIAFFSQFSKGATDSLWLTGVQTVGVTMIFLLSLKKGMGGFGKRDILSLLGAAFGLVLWFFTNDAAYALLLVIFIDSLGAFLTVMKAYEYPESETEITWTLAGISGIFAVASVGKIHFILVIYPLYTAIINLAVVTAIHLGKRR